MQISPTESRILKKVIRAWIESKYGDLANLDYLKQNIDDCTWKFAKRLNSEIGRAVSLDFIFATITETILILYPEYDVKERKRQELENLERKRREAQKVEEQRKQKELEAIRRREEEEERCKREDVLGGDINRIRMIVRDCVCEILEIELEEGIDAEHFGNDLGADEIDELEIPAAIEVALESAVNAKIDFPNELVVGSTINEIAKAYSFYFKHGRYSKKSHLHSYVVAVSQLLCQLEVDAKTFKEALPKLSENYSGTGISIALYGSPSTNRQEVNSMLIDFLMKYAPPWLGSTRQKTIEKLISATQVLIDNPHYSNDYGYDEIKSD